MENDDIIDHSSTGGVVKDTHGDTDLYGKQNRGVRPPTVLLPTPERLLEKD